MCLDLSLNGGISPALRSTCKVITLQTVDPDCPYVTCTALTQFHMHSYMVSCMFLNIETIGPHLKQFAFTKTIWPQQLIQDCQLYLQLPYYS